MTDLADRSRWLGVFHDGRQQAPKVASSALPIRGYRADTARQRPDSGILSVVRQPQPLSAFQPRVLPVTSRARWADSLGEPQLGSVGPGRRLPTASRSHAGPALCCSATGPKPAAPPDSVCVSRARILSLRAAAMYVVGQHGSDRAKAARRRWAALTLTPFVRRRAAEALLRMQRSGEFADTAGPVRIGG